MDSSAAPTQSAPPAVLVLPSEPRLVRAAVRDDLSPGCVTLAASATWGARCGKSARRVLSGGTSPRSHAGSVRPLPRKGQLRRGSAKATAPRPVPTSHDVFHALGIRVARTPIQAAQANGIAERSQSEPQFDGRTIPN